MLACPNPAILSAQDRHENARATARPGASLPRRTSDPQGSCPHSTPALPPTYVLQTSSRHHWYRLTTRAPPGRCNTFHAASKADSHAALRQQKAPHDWWDTTLSTLTVFMHSCFSLSMNGRNTASSAQHPKRHPLCQESCPVESNARLRWDCALLGESAFRGFMPQSCFHHHPTWQVC